MEGILRSGTAYTIIGGINGTLHNHPQLFDGKKGKALVFGGHRRAQFARFRLVPVSLLAVTFLLQYHPQTKF